METSNFDFKTFLSSELQRRIAANPRYSLRAFARKLGMSPSYLSEVLNPNLKKNLSKRKVQEIVKILELQKSDAEHFVFLSSLNAYQLEPAQDQPLRLMSALGSKIQEMAPQNEEFQNRLANAFQKILPDDPNAFDPERLKGLTTLCAKFVEELDSLLGKDQSAAG